jgi:hypothetical protein
LCFNWSYFSSNFNIFSSLKYSFEGFDFISSFIFIVSLDNLNDFWGSSWDFDFFGDIFKKFSDVWVCFF